MGRGGPVPMGGARPRVSSAAVRAAESGSDQWFTRVRAATKVRAAVSRAARELRQTGDEMDR